MGRLPPRGNPTALLETLTAYEPVRSEIILTKPKKTPNKRLVMVIEFDPLSEATRFADIYRPKTDLHNQKTAN